MLITSRSAHQQASCLTDHQPGVRRALKNNARHQPVTLQSGKKIVMARFIRRSWPVRRALPRGHR
jgi:hypothetical protein